MTINKNERAFVFANAPVKLFEGGSETSEREFPNDSTYVKDYYGDIRQEQKELYFQPASLIGIVTGKYGVFEGTLHYQILITGLVDVRTSHGWNPGTYQKTNWFGWASSADITNSLQTALNKVDKRTDNASQAQVEQANKQNQNGYEYSKPPTTTTPTIQTNPIVTKQSINTSQKPSKTIYFVGGGALLFLLGLGLYLRSQKKEEQQFYSQLAQQN